MHVKKSWINVVSDSGLYSLSIESEDPEFDRITSWSRNDE